MKTRSFKISLFGITGAVFIYHLIHLAISWSEIPNEIAIHFTGGTPDNWGSKFFLLGAPILGIFIWFLVGYLVRNPEKMNYVNLTEANKKMQYPKMKKVMTLVQHSAFLTLIFVNEMMLRNTLGLDTSPVFILTIISLAICGAAPFFHLIWAATLKE